jgi:quercetin dioxygenase-like cupin family protein
MTHYGWDCPFHTKESQAHYRSWSSSPLVEKFRFDGSNARTAKQGAVSQISEITYACTERSRNIYRKLHYHSTEQILIVTAGTGIVATETETCTVGVGDLVRIPAGENHWHGATEDSEFSHLYVMPKQSELTQVEP